MTDDELREIEGRAGADVALICAEVRRLHADVAGARDTVAMLVTMVGGVVRVKPSDIAGAKRLILVRERDADGSVVLSVHAAEAKE